MSSVSDMKLIRTDFFLYKPQTLFRYKLAYLQKKQLHKLILNGIILEAENKNIVSNDTEAWVYPGAHEFPPREVVEV